LGLDFYGNYYDQLGDDLPGSCYDYPPGCIISDYNELNFNALSSFVSCGPGDREEYDCICGKLGTGDV
jgi:hypothetical protein